MAGSSPVSKGLNIAILMVGGVFLIWLFMSFNKTSSANDASQVEASTSNEHNQAASDDTSQESSYAAANGWTVTEESDDFSNTTTRFTSINSSNLVEFDFPYNGGAYAGVVFRQKKGGALEALLTVSKGQFLCGFDGCSVQVKVGPDTPQTFSMSGTADHSTTVLFFDNPSRLKKLISKAENFKIRATFYQSGYATFEFKPPTPLP